MGPPSHKLWPFNVFVRTCLFFGVEVVVAPPNELGWQNHIESYNGLWQNRTLRRHRYQSVAEVEAFSERFCHYYNHRRAHPRLRTVEHGTRYPTELFELHRDELRFPPSGFAIADHEDRRGRLQVPLARGRLTYLRRVEAGGVIEVAKAPFFVPASTEGLCVVASVITSRRQLVIRLDGEVIALIASPSERRSPPPTTPWLAEGSTTTSRAKRCREA